MPENITLEQVQTAQNNRFASQTTDMNELKENIAAVLSSFENLVNRVYNYRHTDISAEIPEADYTDIISGNPDLAELSAAGFSALLNTGDSIYTQGNICYINGELCDGLTSDGEAGYTFTGENGAELVKVWYFENDGTLVCNKCEGNLIDVIIRKKTTEITIADGFLNHANSIETNILLPYIPYGARRQKNTLTGSYVDKISLELEEYGSAASAITASGEGTLSFNGSRVLRKVRFPNLITLPNCGNDNFFVSNCVSLITDDDSFPNLQSIGNSSLPAQWSFFKNVPTLVLPESLTSIGSGVSLNNKIVIAKFRDAAAVHTNWCASAPTERFEMVDDWGASINIATAAANWSKADFADFFTDNLRDMEDEVREIKIPSEIYDSLTDEEFALAEDKGWTVGA